MNPLISVVIPSYNHAHLIRKALQSLKEQTCQNWEAIIVDNNSTDDTDRVVSSCSDPRIRIIKVNNNGIIAVSRNEGIRNARGLWIALLDSDDWWTANKLEECIKHFASADIIFHDLKIIGNKKGWVYKKKVLGRTLYKPIIIDLLINGNPIANSSVMVRSELMHKITINESTEMIAAEDYNTWLKIAEITDKFLYIPKVLGYYLIHNQSISKQDMSLPLRNAVAGFRNKLNKSQDDKLKAFIEYTHGRYCFLHCKFDQAYRSLCFSLKNGGWELRMKSAVMLIKIILNIK